MRQLYHHIYLECLELASESVLGRTKSPLILPSYYYINDERRTRYVALTLDPAVRADERKEFAQVQAFLNQGSQPGISWQLKTAESIMKEPAALRPMVAHALGVDSTKMMCLAEQRQYVFTPQLVVKMLKLDQYASAHRNVVFRYVDSSRPATAFSHNFSQRTNWVGKDGAA